jgi:hypothetical protein
MVEITNNVSQMVMQKIENLQNFQGDLKFPNAEKIRALANRIKKKWFSAPIFVREKDDDNAEKFILDWHQRLKALLLLQEEGFELVDGVPCVYIRASTEQEARERVLEYNSSYSSIDVHYLQEVFMLELDVEDIHIYESNVKLLPFDAPAIGEPQAPKGSLVDTFIIPPFSVLDTKQGYWVERKRLRNHLIGDEWESRDGTLQQLHNAEKYGKESFKWVSILDAVLAEIMVRWFCPSNGKTFDCFAGDTVFGFVSSYIGNEFTGIELREEQASLNNARVQEANLKAKYICDDGQNVHKHLEAKSQDMFFSCPPYFDLEEYSDLPNDASNQKNYEGFINIIKTAFTGAMNCLKDDRFAVVVMSNVRAKDGAYYDICGDITRIMQACGLVLYNDIVLLNSIGTVAIRAGRFFNSGRKVWRCHQQVLVYYKGNIKNIKSNFEPLDFSSLETSNENI